MPRLKRLTYIKALAKPLMWAKGGFSFREDADLSPHPAYSSQFRLPLNIPFGLFYIF